MVKTVLPSGPSTRKPTEIGFVGLSAWISMYFFNYRKNRLNTDKDISCNMFEQSAEIIVSKENGI